MNLVNYFEFIDGCKKEIPEKYHKHHIIPKYMGGSNEEDNLIKLSYENHYAAHIILAECFETGSYHYNRNIWSALRLIGWKNEKQFARILLKYPFLFLLIISNHFLGKAPMQYLSWPVF